MSRLNRLSERPTGVWSKKETGERVRAPRAAACTDLDARAAEVRLVAERRQLKSTKASERPKYPPRRSILWTSTGGEAAAAAAAARASAPVQRDSHQFVKTRADCSEAQRMSKAEKAALPYRAI